jgi:hypothetical protein
VAEGEAAAAGIGAGVVVAAAAAAVLAVLPQPLSKLLESSAASAADTDADCADCASEGLSLLLSELISAFIRLFWNFKYNIILEIQSDSRKLIVAYTYRRRVAIYLG